MHVTDWNGDGQADLLIGDVRWACYKLSPLTPKQLSGQAMVKPVYDEGRKAQAELMNERNALVRARKPIPDELTQRIKGQRVKYAAAGTYRARRVAIDEALGARGPEFLDNEAVREHAGAKMLVT